MKGDKPWQNEPGGRSVEGFLGAYGVKTSLFETTEELILEAARVYEIQPSASVQEMADAISAIPKPKRRALAAKNIVGTAPRAEQMPGLFSALSPEQQKQAPQYRGPENHGSDEFRRGVSEWKRRQESGGDHAALLHQAVMAIINSGHGEVLRDAPDVMAYYGSKLPTVAEVVGDGAKITKIVGEIHTEDRVYRVWSCGPAKAA